METGTFQAQEPLVCRPGPQSGARPPGALRGYTNSVGTRRPEPHPPHQAPVSCMALGVLSWHSQHTVCPRCPAGPPAPTNMLTCPCPATDIGVAELAHSVDRPHPSLHRAALPAHLSEFAKLGNHTGCSLCPLFVNQRITSQMLSLLKKRIPNKAQDDLRKGCVFPGKIVQHFFNLPEDFFVRGYWSGSLEQWLAEAFKTMTPRAPEICRGTVAVGCATDQVPGTSGRLRGGAGSAVREKEAAIGCSALSDHPGSLPKSHCPGPRALSTVPVPAFGERPFCSVVILTSFLI